MRGLKTGGGGRMLQREIRGKQGEKMMWKLVKTTGVVLFLLLCSVQDIKEKRISVKMLLLSGGLFLALSFLFDELSWERRMENMLPGVTALVAAFLTREQIGYGDAVCLAVLGSVVSADILWSAILNGLLFLSACSIVLLVRKKAGKNTTLPFIPFLTVGILWQMVK